MPSDVTRSDWSDPLATESGSDKQLSGYFYEPGEEGQLRLWKLNGSSLRDPAPIDAASPGDFILGDDAPVAASCFGFSEENRTVTIYVEAIKVSEEAGDREVAITIEYAIGGEIGSSSHLFRFTVLQSKTVEILQDGTISPVEVMEDSHSSPVIDVSELKVSNVYPSADGSEVLADLSLSGEITCALCDLIPGSGSTQSGYIEGTINKMYVFMNQYEDPIEFSSGQDWCPLTVFKAKPGDPESTFGRPYAFRATFENLYLYGVPVEACTNKLILMASFDGAPRHREASSLTGFSEHLIEIDATLLEGTDEEPIESFAAIDVLRVSPVTGDSYSVVVKVSGQALKSYSLARCVPGSRVFTNQADPYLTPTAWLVRDSDTSVSLSVPELKIWDALLPLTPDESDPSIMVLERPTTTVVEVSFASTLDPEVQDTAQVRINAGDWEELTETQPDSAVFESADGTTKLRLLAEYPDTNIPAIAIELTDGELEWDARPLLLVVQAISPAFVYSVEDQDDLIDDGVDDDTSEGQNFGFNFTKPSTDAGTISISSASSGGSLHAYGTQILGPDTVLDEMAKADNVMKRQADSPGGGQGSSIYLNSRFDQAPISVPAGNPPSAPLTPEQRAARKVALRACLVLDADDKWWKHLDFSSIGTDMVKFLAGFGKGFGMGAVDCLGEAAKGIGGMIWDKAKNLFKSPVETAMEGLNHKTLRFRQMGTLAKVLGELIWKYAAGEQSAAEELYNEIAAGEHPELKQLSDEVRMTMEFVVDMFRELYDKFVLAFDTDIAYDPFRQGEAFGKFMFEVFTTVQPYAKAGKLAALGGKMAWLESKMPALKTFTTKVRQGEAYVAKMQQALTNTNPQSLGVVQSRLATMGNAASKRKPVPLDPKKNRSTRTASRMLSLYQEQRAKNYSPKTALQVAFDKSKDPPRDWDGFLFVVYESDMGQFYSQVGTYPNYTWSRALLAKAPGSDRISRKAPEKPAKGKTMVGTKKIWSRKVLDVHHGVPKQIQENLTRKIGSTVAYDDAPSFMMSKFLHVAAKVVNPNAIHRLLEVKQMGAHQVNNTKKAGLKLQMGMVRNALAEAYDTNGMPKFRDRSLDWLDANYQ